MTKKEWNEEHKDCPFRMFVSVEQDSSDKTEYAACRLLSGAEVYMGRICCKQSCGPIYWHNKLQLQDLTDMLSALWKDR